MTKFNRKKFTKASENGGYVHYEGQFVARFRTGGSRSFISFLVKNFTVEEYFDLLKNSTPIQVLETKGYISDNVRKCLRFGGYPETQEGLNIYLKREREL